MMHLDDCCCSSSLHHLHLLLHLEPDQKETTRRTKQQQGQTIRIIAYAKQGIWLSFFLLVLLLTLEQKQNRIKDQSWRWQTGAAATCCYILTHLSPPLPPPLLHSGCCAAKAETKVAFRSLEPDRRTFLSTSWFRLGSRVTLSRQSPSHKVMS